MAAAMSAMRIAVRVESLSLALLASGRRSCGPALRRCSCEAGAGRDAGRAFRRELRVRCTVLIETRAETETRAPAPFARATAVTAAPWALTRAEERDRSRAPRGAACGRIVPRA